MCWCLVHSKSIFEPSKETAEARRSAAELSRVHMETREMNEAGMMHVEESYKRLGNGIDRLKEETRCMQREIKG